MSSIAIRGTTDKSYLLMQCIKYSTFPFCPRIGDSMIPLMQSPSASSSPFTRSTAACLFTASFTMPPLPTSPLPTSNWGFMRATIFPSAARNSRTFGTTLFSDMNETSIVAIIYYFRYAPISRWRILVLSRSTTRGSCLSFHAS